MTGTITIAVPGLRTYSRWYWFKWRLSRRLHLTPKRVTEAWYEQDCPSVLDVSFLTRAERLRWALDMWLRECNRRVAT